MGKFIDFGSDERTFDFLTIFDPSKILVGLASLL